MASDAEFRKLNSLRVIDLRTELGKRNLDKTGVKNELIERLQKALVSEGHDPDSFVFRVDSAENKNSRNSKRRTMDESDGDRDDGMNDWSLASEDDVRNMKEDVEENIESEDVTEEKYNANEMANTETGEETVATVQSMESETKCGQSEELAADMTSSNIQKENTKEKVENVKSEEISDNNKIENNSPKEQRIKKIVNEEPKENADVKCVIKDEENATKVEETVIEKSTDANKEDNEDSINLTIGEEERKLFGEEEDSTSHEKDEKDQPQNTTVEMEKENANDDSKNESDSKTDDKSLAKKNSVSRGTGNSRNLWVSGLSSMTRATDLKTLFSKYGKVVAAKIVTNAKTPGSRCYGYVTMLSTEDATISMQNLHKTELDGRLILVERAKDDGTGPARSKKEAEKRKPDVKDEKKSSADEKRKTTVAKTNNSEAKTDEKKAAVDKNEKKSSSVKDSDENVAGEVRKTGSVKSEKISTHRERSRSRKSKDGPYHRPRDGGRNSKPRTGVLTFAQIKEERERHRLREKERALRLEERRRQIERERQREIDRRQQQEAMRLERERIKLKLEKDEMRAKMLAIERETQRLERERLMREKEELRRAQQKLEETRKAVKRPLDLPRGYDEDRKRRPPSPDRRHVHLSSSVAPRKDFQRSNGDRRPSPYSSSRRPYDTSRADSRGKDALQTSRDKSSKDSSRYGSSRDVPSMSKGGVPPAPPMKKFASDDRRYDHHYQSSHVGDDMRSKDVRHRYADPSQSSSSSKTSSIKGRHDRYPEPPKSSSKDGGRYERNNTSDTWTRQSSSNVSSSKPFSSVSSSSNISSRDTWTSKSEQPPWTRGTVNSSTSDRWGGSSGSASGMIRSGQLTGNNMYSSSNNYSDSMQTMGMIAMSSNSSYNDRFDAYKPTMRKY